MLFVTYRAKYWWLTISTPGQWNEDFLKLTLEEKGHWKWQLDIEKLAL